MRPIQLDFFEKEIVGFAHEIVFYLEKSGIKPEDAKDVTQDVLLQILESHLVLPADKIRAWMYRVAIRKYIDRFRRDQKYLDILQQEFFKTDNVIEKIQMTLSRSMRPCSSPLIVIVSSLISIIFKSFR